MGWFFAILLIAVIGLFVWAHYKVKADEERLLEEDPGTLYPFFGVFTSRCIYTTNTFEKDVVLVNSDTGKIYIGRKIYNMSDITRCETKTSGGKMLTSYEDKTYIKTNTGSAIGRAVIGGAIAGGLGAIVGASTANKEIKTDRVAKKTYVGESYWLYLVINGKRELFPALGAKSENEIDEVALFINGELVNYRKKVEEQLSLSKKKKEEQWLEFINSLSEFDVEKIIDTASKFKNDRLTEDFITFFENTIGVKGIKSMYLGDGKLDINGRCDNMKDTEDSVLSLNKYIVRIFGTPQSEIRKTSKDGWFKWENKDYTFFYSESKDGEYNYYVRIQWKLS